MTERLSLEAAVEVMRAQRVLRKTEKIPLPSALDRVLAQEVSASIPVPPFDKSPFDGYALRSEDAPGLLKIAGVTAAGDNRADALEHGYARRIFTGAPIPEGADAVVRQESVKLREDGVWVPMGIQTGNNIVRRGEDLAPGALIARPGQRLSPPLLGVLASQGLETLCVYNRPLAVILPTGNELFEPGEACRPYGIYNSSSPVLAAYLSRIGFAVKREHIVPDDPVRVCRSVRELLEGDASIVFTTGGASVGDYDFAETSAKALGAETLIQKVNVKPGGALLVSRVGEKLLVSLSGNPAAAVMSLLVVLLPYLFELTGEKLEAERIRLPLLDEMPKTSAAVRLLRGRLAFEDGTVWFAENRGRGNGNLSSFLNCELIGIAPCDAGPLQRGDVIEALRLPNFLC